MSDDRFKALAKDPRYRLPNRKEARTAVDPRFSRLFKDQDFRKKASVDRYGRKVKAEAGTKELERLYRLDKAEKEEDDDDEDDESEDDEALVEKRDPARDGGFSESSSEEESSDEEDDVEAELAEETAGQEQTESIPMGEVTKRIAAVNLDWDNIRASDIMAVASSFAPSNGRILNVTVYPSEFGRERMEHEEVHGPPKEIFSSSKAQNAEEEDDESEEEPSEDEEVDSEDEEKIRRKLIAEQANEGEEFDTAKLRQYQLDRLRYYYAVITCDSKTTGKALYDSMDGREYLSTANFFDLRFIPDETDFDDDKSRDECSSLPENYKPNEFRTEALTHSKVRLTWDADDTTRKEVQKRAFSRAEIDENDLQAYIGSDSSDAESVSSRKSTTTPEERKAAKKEAQRLKMRAALGLGAESTKKSAKDEPVGDMQITFTSGLSGSTKEGKGVFENEPQDEESTRARYIRKERERKQKRKEKNKNSRGEGEAVEEDKAEEVAADASSNEDDPFNDPFFNDPAAAAALEKKQRQAERKAKRDNRIAAEAEAESRRAELELLMAEDNGDAMRHFDMREVEKAEKAARRKGKKGKKNSGKTEESGGGEGEKFAVETADPRFAALFDSHEYAIDPTNPRFKGTEGMKALLEEGRKKRKRDGRDGEDVEDSNVKRKGAKTDNEDELKGLVARLKGKSRK